MQTKNAFNAFGEYFKERDAGVFKNVCLYCVGGEAEKEGSGGKGGARQRQKPRNGFFVSKIRLSSTKVD